MVNANQEIVERGIHIMIKCHTDQIEIAIGKEIEEKFREALDRAMISMTLSLIPEEKQRMLGSISSTCATSMDRLQ